MNMRFTGRLLQTVLVKVTNPANCIYTQSAIKLPSVNNASNEMKLRICGCRTSLIYNNGIIRHYKNFGHKDPEPKYPKGSGIARYLAFYQVYLAVVPLACWINWKYLIWYFKPEWSEKIEPEQDLEHLYPTRPRGI